MSDLNAVRITNRVTTPGALAACQCGWRFSDADMGAVQLAAAKHTPCTRHHTWVSGCYFDFEQEFQSYVGSRHRLYLRHRSDGKMFYAVRRMNNLEGMQEMFDYLLGDDPGSLAYSDEEYQEEVKCIFVRKRGHDLVWEFGVTV
jgi:hypothetical protein